jgi:hypothetical protein
MLKHTCRSEGKKQKIAAKLLAGSDLNIVGRPKRTDFKSILKELRAL